MLRRHNLLTLNHDVTSFIFSELRQSDLREVALTCRTAHVLASPYVLAEVTIPWQVTRSDQGKPKHRLAQFCVYMLSDVTHRLPLLRSFTVYADILGRITRGDSDFHAVCHSTAQLLALVLRLGTNLRKLYLWGAESLFRAVPNMADAVIDLVALDTIGFLAMHQQTLRVLSCMKSRPHTVECSLFDDGVRRVSGVYAPVYVGDIRPLHNFTSSLTTLKLSVLPDIVERLDPNTVWPAVQFLVVETARLWSTGASWPPLDTVMWRRAFPNLRCLKIEGVMPSQSPSTLRSITADDGTGNWPYLDFVSTRTPIAVGRTVRRLRFRSEEPELPRQYAMAEEFLQSSQPVVLACDADVQLLTSLRTTAASSLRVLQLFTSYVYPIPRDSGQAGLREDRRNIQPLLDTIFSMLGSIRLRAVTLTTNSWHPPVDAQSVLQRHRGLVGVAERAEAGSVGQV
ncbi:hypothetical protein FOMPIDRAFT_1024071 [Fomitopsis schrenkii]|uniref:F-box domain-containing protein n=1 Tax=Fomitopsis schrenkii TaxID=2126942 RepID=S8E3U5_FOMSC|nr:hypothetical protein FOMPIDRAFT_1024071 [Fomitopsis schrenkii]